MNIRGRKFRNVHIDALEEGDVYTVKGINLYGPEFKETTETGTVVGNGYKPSNGGASHMDECGYSGSVFRKAA